MIYPLHQSPLFKLRSRRKLASLLRVSPGRIKALAQSDNYSRFEKVEPGRKPRLVEHPKPTLMEVHRRVLALLERIELPEYLHSARKGRSYKTNAEVHIGDVYVAKLDIRKFYPSTSSGQIYRYFFKDLKQEPDIAWLLMRLCTCDAHLPTGSPISALLAFHVHRGMFDAMHEIATALDVKMTCYIDDVTFSGPRATKRLLWQLASIVSVHGMVAHKFHTYPANHPKRITGAIVTSDKVRLPNVRHLRITQELRAVERLDSADPARVFALRKLRGRIAEAKSLEPTAAARMLYLWKKLQAA